MVLMNLSAEEQWRHRPREQTCEDGRGGGAEGGTDGESGVETTHYHTQNSQPVGVCCMIQGTQTGAL